MTNRLYAGLLGVMFIAAPVLAEEAPPQRVWQISSFLKGTTSQIRDTVNGQLEGMLSRKAEKVSRRDQLKADLDARYAALGSSGGVSTTRGDVKTSEAQLVAARSAGDSAGLIDA